MLIRAIVGSFLLLQLFSAETAEGITFLSLAQLLISEKLIMLSLSELHKAIVDSCVNNLHALLALSLSLYAYYDFHTST